MMSIQILISIYQYSLNSCQHAYNHDFYIDFLKCLYAYQYHVKLLRIADNLH